jgi:hypothetical protein
VQQFGDERAYVLDDLALELVGFDGRGVDPPRE